MSVLDEETSTSTGDPRDPELRLSALLDPGSIDPLAGGGGAVAVCGLADGAKVVAFCTDARRMGGALGAEGCRVITHAIETALDLDRPVIGLWHSGGAVLNEGVLALEAVGAVFAAMTRASGRIPQISVVLGPAAGGAAYGPALTDIVIMSEPGRMFITGPEVLRTVTGEVIDPAELGGPRAHAGRSGVVHVVADGEADAFAHARRIATLLTVRGDFRPGLVPDSPELASVLPHSTRRAYDVRAVLNAILDAGLEELQAKWAPNIVVGLGRLAGGTVGVVANNPLRKGGCLDSLSAEKAARFVRMCDALGVPLLVVVDVPGYLPGVRQEWEGVIRRGAKLLHAFAGAVVPRVTLITRKSYGGAYIAMNSRSLGATRVLAWPDAEIAVMGAEAAVGILHRRTLAAAADDVRERLLDQLVRQQVREAGGVRRAMEIGAVDEIVEPAATRRRLAEAFATAPARRGTKDNIPL